MLQTAGECKTVAMKPKNVYLVLCAAGIVIPYTQLLPWLFEHGLNLPLLIE